MWKRCERSRKWEKIRKIEEIGKIVIIKSLILILYHYKNIVLVNKLDTKPYNIL